MTVESTISRARSTPECSAVEHHTTGARWRLSQAASRHGAALARWNQITDAIDKASEARFQASQARAKAEKALDAAKAGEPARLAAAALGETTTVSPVAKAQRDFDTAVAKHSAARETIAALEKTRAEAEREVEAAVRDRDVALAAVLQSSPVVMSLIDGYYRKRAEVLAFREALRVVEREQGIPPSHRFWENDHAHNGHIDTTLSRQWQSVIDELKAGDSDAPLPT